MQTTATGLYSPIDAYFEDNSIGSISLSDLMRSKNSLDENTMHAFARCFAEALYPVRGSKAKAAHSIIDYTGPIIDDMDAFVVQQTKAGPRGLCKDHAKRDIVRGCLRGAAKPPTKIPLYISLDDFFEDGRSQLTMRQLFSVRRGRSKCGFKLSASAVSDAVKMFADAFAEDDLDLFADILRYDGPILSQFNDAAIIRFGDENVCTVVDDDGDKRRAIIEAIKNWKEPEPVKEKKCTKCGRILPATAFAKDSYTADQLSSWCNECRAERKKEKAARGPKPAAETGLDVKTTIAAADTARPLEKFSTKQLVAELKRRGFEGELKLRF